ncbi:PIG-L family deacetylase [Kitasatospora gansuensis]
MVQIVAHEDDDLLFMNPDVSNGIAAGIPTLTVYLTAGENVPGAVPGMTPEEYAASRQNGIRSSYAAMAGAGGDGCILAVAGPGGCWTEDVDHELLGPGKFVQRFFLDSHPTVQLAFLNLAEAGDGRFNEGNTLRKLATDPNLVSDMLDMGGRDPEIPDAYRVDGGDVVDILKSLLTETGATLIRAQDSAPDKVEWVRDWLPDHDHEDHVYASRIADRAAAAYRSVNPRTLLEHYRQYNIDSMPGNLMPSQAAEKKARFVDRYLPHDPWLQGHLEPSYNQWWAAQYSRTPRPVQAAITDPNGVLHLFVVLGGSLWEWTRTDSAQSTAPVWSGPVDRGNPGGALAAGLSAARNKDGRIEVFGQRSDNGELVSLFQNGSGWGWGSLGNPNLPADATSVSSPVVVPNEDGRLQAFVRNAGGGVSTRWQLAVNGAWSGWADMQGDHVQGPVTAVVTYDKRIELFAPVSGNSARVLHWFQPAINAPFQVDQQFPAARPASGLSAGTDADGRIELVYREAGTGGAMTIYQNAPGGGWSGPSAVGGSSAKPGGTGELAVATGTDGRMVIAARNQGGGVSLSQQATAGQAFGGWTDARGYIVGNPMSVVNGHGNVTLIGLKPNGALAEYRRDGYEASASWHAVG